MDVINSLGPHHTVAAWPGIGNRGGGCMSANEEFSYVPWEEYERRKAAIQRMGLSDREYELAIRRLADELGV